MPASNSPFSTTNNSTVRLAVTASNTTGTLTVQSNQLRVYNLGPNKCYLRHGTGGTQTAVTTDTPFAVGLTDVITKPPGDLNVAAICDATETATLFLTPVEGT